MPRTTRAVMTYTIEAISEKGFSLVMFNDLLIGFDTKQSLVLIGNKAEIGIGHSVRIYGVIQYMSPTALLVRGEVDFGNTREPFVEHSFEALADIERRGVFVQWREGEVVLDLPELQGSSSEERNRLYRTLQEFSSLPMKIVTHSATTE